MLRANYSTYYLWLHQLRKVVVVSVRWFASAVAPVLLGNMVGGTALFAHISYAQVMEEI